MADDCGCPTSFYRLHCNRKGKDDEKDYCVTIRDDKLCLAFPNDSDPDQLWHKDERGSCGFMLVHKATNKAVKYEGQGDQLILVNKPIYLDKTVVWDESEDIKSGYKYIRTQIDPDMVMDAYTGIIDDGTKISIYPENKKVNAPPKENADNQLWKFILACKTFY
ncbi:ricin B-like lectin EULS3 isoform X1 [Silene latifolia]|uniref:ricin B-like lectin EULS3 isoform X1 n=1 Tax=Silene latifolia TaxID=37657 RepID=UPI003D781E05